MCVDLRGRFRRREDGVIFHLPYCYINNKRFILEQAYPCKKCFECKSNYRFQWSLRCAIESLNHDENIFCTLTYSDENIPDGGSLDRSAVSGFMKRLRQTLSRQGFKSKLKYYYCGEYGGQIGRPHYHVIIFGYFPGDSVKKCKRKNKIIYTSEILNTAWQDKGFVEFSSLHPADAPYVAGYTTKKLSLNQHSQLYPELVPEFTCMSKGIGASLLSDPSRFDANTGVFNFNGKEHKLLRYFKRLLSRIGGYSEAIEDLNNIGKMMLNSTCLDKMISRKYNVRHKSSFDVDRAENKRMY